METNNWSKPEIKDLGKAEDIIKSIDVDGTGDSNFPVNLSSPN